MEPVGQRDEALMALAQAGDHAAFEVVFARWREKIFYFLLRRTGSRQAAEEAFSNTWLRVWQWRSRYDPERPFRPWLYTVAGNAGHDARKPRPDDFELKVDPGGPRDPQAARDALISVLHMLAPGDRKLMLLVAEGFNASEIGQMEGLKAGTVRMRINRARARLLEQISKSE